MGFDGISDIFRRVRQKFPALSQRIEEAQALARWPSAVGPQIAKHTRPIQVLDGVLWVEVDHPVWKSELHHRKRQILEQLNRKLEEPAPPPLPELRSPRKRATQSVKAARAAPPARPATPPVILQDILFLDPKPGFSNRGGSGGGGFSRGSGSGSGSMGPK